MGQRIGGRTKGTPNKDKVALRELVSERVAEFTLMRREILRRQWRQGMRFNPKSPANELEEPGEFAEWNSEEPEIPEELLDMLQPEIGGYDPVVEMALIAVDGRHSPELRQLANSNAAQFLRPKLKSIELTKDPADAENEMRRIEMTGQLLETMKQLARDKRALVDVTPVVEVVGREKVRVDADDTE